MDDQVKSYGRNAGAATQMARPEKDPALLRMGLMLLLAALIPPVGILFAWRSRYIALRGRLLLSVMASVAMTAMMVAFMGGTPAAAIRPTPSVPTDYGYAVPTAVPAPNGGQVPSDDGKSNVVEGNPAGEADAAGLGVTPAPGQEGAAPAQPDEDTQVETTPAPTADPLDATIVYAVKTNATMYHAADQCDGQVNRRVLTLREALAEGLAPCPKCNPPTAESLAGATATPTP